MIRTSTRTTCSDLERIDWQTPIFVCQRCHGIHMRHSRDPRRSTTRLLKRSEVGYSSFKISPTLGQDCLEAGRARLSRVFDRTMECLGAALWVGCRTAERSPRAVMGTDCFYLAHIHWQTPILLSSQQHSSQAFKRCRIFLVCLTQILSRLV